MQGRAEASMAPSPLTGGAQCIEVGDAGGSQSHSAPQQLPGENLTDGPSWAQKQLKLIGCEDLRRCGKPYAHSRGKKWMEQNCCKRGLRQKEVFVADRDSQVATRKDQRLPARAAMWP